MTAESFASTGSAPSPAGDSWSNPNTETPSGGGSPSYLMGGPEQDTHQTSDTAQSVETTTDPDQVDSFEETKGAEQDIDSDYEEIEHSDYSSSGEFSWQQVAQVLNFVNKLNSLSPANLAAFQNIFLVDGNPLDIAQSLYYSPSSRVGAIQFLFKVGAIQEMVKEDYMYPATLTAELSSYDTNFVRDITRAANSLSESFAEEEEQYVIRYRKTMESTEVVRMLASSMESIPPDALKQLAGFSELLNMWPGQL